MRVSVFTFYSVTSIINNGRREENILMIISLEMSISLGFLGGDEEEEEEKGG